MEILFFNFPKNVSYDTDLILHFQIVAQTLSREAPKIDFHCISEENPKVHILVISVPERMKDNERRQLAWHILWFLHLHSLDIGSDVRYPSFKKNGIFTIKDFPELLEKPHPSVK